MQKTQSGKETVAAKETYKRMYKFDGIKVKQYHVDKEVFKSAAYKDHYINQGQGMLFAGVDAHCMNNVAEARVRSELTRTILAPAEKWPSKICSNP